MSSVCAVPQVLGNAASDLAGIGSAVDAANTAATGPTTTMLAAGADEVSTAVKSLFSAHARAFQEVSAQAAEFHAQFVRALTGAGGAYAAAESANVAPLQGVAQAVASATNYGYGNVGSGNVGFFNIGNYNFGIGNNGSLNLGIGNLSPNFPVNPNNITAFGGAGLFNNGIDNVGAFNTGSINIGIGNVSPHFAVDPANITKFGNLGLFNNGIDNVGIGNVGTGNTGFPVSLLGLLGVGNHGSDNQGLFNYGNDNLGIGLTGDHRMGVGPFYVTH
jgi:PPE-repeat protein